MNVNYTKNNRLCLGCGLCEDVCPTNSIQVKIDNGEYRPTVDNSKCLGDQCSRCVKICPGLGVNLHELTEKVLPQEGAVDNNYIGRYQQLYTGYCTDENIRFHSASGGMVTGVLIYLLEKRIINGAVVTRFSAKDNLTSETFIANTKEELIAARSSKYCPVSMQGIRKQIREAEGKYVIVGLPCHIHGFRKIEETDKKFKEHVFAYFGIYCSSGRTYNLTDYVLSRRGIGKETIKYFAYRDEGCLGSLVVKYAPQTKVTGSVNSSSPNILSNSERVYKESFGKYYCTLRSFFIPRRCHFCVDHFAELADISFGDVHIKPYSNDTIGVNSIVARTVEMNEVLKQAASEGFLRIEGITPDVLNSSQQMAKTKKHKYYSYVHLLRSLGQAVPQYDVEYKRLPYVKAFIGYLCLETQRFVGNNQYFWPLIDLLKKKNGKDQ